jgi:transposase
LARLGIDLPRATLCNWARQVAERASPLADLMDRAIREGPIVNIDETTVQVLQEPGRSEEALEFIARLYRIEKEARLKELPAPALCELRQQQAKPVLAEFKRWLEEKAPLTPPSGLLSKAIGYTLNQWPRLIAYLQDGRLQPDNNLMENAIRPFVVGRKNWLFSGHPRGVAASDFLYSLIETAKANGLKPYLYLRHLFDHLPLKKTEEDYRNLLPPYMDASRLNPTAA